MAGVTDLTANAERVRVDAEGDESLLSVLRDRVGATGTKYGCGEGQCGACTVLLDGSPVRSCITPVAAAAGRSITTIEGLAKDGELHPLQQAFLDLGALQCGYCTPGMILSAVGLLSKTPAPSRADILRFMQGNVCRCGTYPRIAAAIEKAARAMSEEG